MRALLIAGGPIDIRWASEFVKMHNYNKIIAVDGGLSTANLLDICPDMVVGDFDTVSEDIVSHYSDKGCIIEKLNPIKDDTDTQYAVCRLIEMGVREIDILGGTGGRMDHTLSNIYMLKLAYENGIKAVMYDRVNKMSVITGKNHIKKDEIYGRYISFIQLEGPVRDVTMSGFAYNVEHFDFDTDKQYRLAVSNEFVNDVATVDIGEGMFVMLEISGD